MSPFSLDKRSKPQCHIHAILLNQLYELHQISSSRKIELMKTKTKKTLRILKSSYIEGRSWAQTDQTWVCGLLKTMVDFFLNPFFFIKMCKTILSSLACGLLKLRPTEFMFYMLYKWICVFYLPSLVPAHAHSKKHMFESCSNRLVWLSW